MSVLKKIGIVLGALLILFLVLGIFMPKKAIISKSLTIEAPANYVFNIVNDFKTNPEWNPWVQDDPEMKLSYGAKTSGVGASYSWTSKASGNGSASYTNVVENKSIEALLNFDGMDPSKYSFNFEPKGPNETEVTWSMDTRFGFPFNVFAPVFKYMINKSYKKGLKNLEKMAESRIEDGEYLGFEVKDELYDQRSFIMNRSEVAIPNIQSFYTQNLGAIFKKVQDEGLTMSGMPSGLFFKYDELEGKADMAAAIPVKSAKDIQGLNSITIPKQQCIVVEYYGDYKGLSRAHDAAKAYMNDRKLLNNPPIIEEYVTDPIKEKDPKKWLTKVIYYYTKSGM